MKKQILALTLAGTMMAALAAGCGSSSTASASSAAASGTTSASTTSEDAYNISMIVKHTDSHFLKVMAGAQAYADENGINLEIMSPTAQSMYDEQQNMIETCLGTTSTDAVVIAPLQSETAANLVEGTDKTIVAFDTDFTSDYKSTFVGTGNETAAKQGGEAMVKMAQENGVENPTVVILTGVQGDETHDARMNGFKEGVEEAGGTVVDVQYTDATADKAATSMEAVMQNFPEGVDIVLGIADDISLAAVKVIQDSGSAAYADTLVCGFDGNQTALEAIQAGTLAMSIAQEGYEMGYLAVEAAVTVLNGGTVDSYIDSGSTLVDSSNVEEYIERMKELGVWDE